MTDQKIEEIRARLAAKYATHSADLRADCHWLLTELDRLKTELATCGDDLKTALRERDDARFLLGQANTALKASGTFSDGVEAAAKWHDDRAAAFDVRACNHLLDESDRAKGREFAVEHEGSAAAIRALDKGE